MLFRSVICTSNNGTIAKSILKDNLIKHGFDLFSLKIYPNPVVDNTLNLVITCHGVTGIQLSILNIEGKLMLSQKGMLVMQGSFARTIDVSSLPKGIYILKLSNEKEQRAVKFVKAIE